MICAADQPEVSDFSTPAIVDRDPVVVAIGTEGTAPVLSRQIKASVESLLEPGLGLIARLASGLRPWVGQNVPLGKMRRDFVFIDDLVEAIRRLVDVPPVRPKDGEVTTGDSLSPVAPYRLVNIGKSAPDTLMEFIGEIESALGMEAEKDFQPMQQGDVLATWADASLLEHLTGYKPSTPLSDGIPKFIDWYRAFHGRNSLP